jgi:hypothetical protein
MWPISLLQVVGFGLLVYGTVRVLLSSQPDAHSIHHPDGCQDRLQHAEQRELESVDRLRTSPSRFVQATGPTPILNVLATISKAINGCVHRLYTQHLQVLRCVSLSSPISSSPLTSLFSVHLRRQRQPKFRFRQAPPSGPAQGWKDIEKPVLSIPNEPPHVASPGHAPPVPGDDALNNLRHVSTAIRVSRGQWVQTAPVRGQGKAQQPPSFPTTAGKAVLRSMRRCMVPSFCNDRASTVEAGAAQRGVGPRESTLKPAASVMRKG